MSKDYTEYLTNHRLNVTAGFDWIKAHLPELLKEGYNWGVINAHDLSKTEQDEYEAYDEYFYGGNKSFKVVQKFRMAWLTHIHRNPHHWQYWILINDNPSEGQIILEMPYNYILEMMCDWWSFGWAKGDPAELFSWYDKHKEYIQLHPKTRKEIRLILDKIKMKLSEKGGG